MEKEFREIIKTGNWNEVEKWVCSNNGEIDLSECKNSVQVEKIINIIKKVFTNNSNSLLIRICSEALASACEKNDLDMVSTLLANGANVNAYGKNRLLPMHIAVKNMNIDIVRFLIEKGAYVDGVTKICEHELHNELCVLTPITPLGLLWSEISEQIDDINASCGHKWDDDEWDDDECDDEFNFDKAIEITWELLYAGAETKKIYYDKKQRAVVILSGMVEAYEKINQPENKKKIFSIIEYVCKNEKNMIDKNNEYQCYMGWIRHEERIENITKVSYEWGKIKAPIHCVNVDKETELLELFLKNGFSGYMKDVDGKTLMHKWIYQCYFGNRKDAMEIMLKYGVNPHMKDREDFTPLSYLLNMPYAFYPEIYDSYQQMVEFGVVVDDPVAYKWTDKGQYVAESEDSICKHFEKMKKQYEEYAEMERLKIEGQIEYYNQKEKMQDELPHWSNDEDNCDEDDMKSLPEYWDGLYNRHL